MCDIGGRLISRSDNCTILKRKERVRLGLDLKYGIRDRRLHRMKEYE